MTEQALLDRLKRYSKKCLTERTDGDFADAVYEASSVIGNLSVKHGKWIPKEGYDGDIYWDCSNCGESWTTLEGEPFDNGMNYCPQCGARMDGE